MSIGINDEHIELADSLRKWASSLAGIEAARAAESDPAATFDEIWRSVGEMGVATIGLPEAVGGAGGSPLDLAVALEACVHGLVPGPLLGAAVAAHLLGDVDEVGAALASGEMLVGLSLDSDLRAVWDASSATHLLLPDQRDAWWLVAVGAATVEPSLGLDLSRRFAAVEVDLSEAHAIPHLDRDLVRRTALTFAAAEAAGIARWCLATAVDHAKVREQFGQKIGSFQAVKHLCAEMLETAEAVTAVAWDVASAASADDEQWAFAADVAQAVALDGAVATAKTCIQVLGGIGFTYEHDVHLYLRRALSLRALLGDADTAAARLTERTVSGARRHLEVDLEGRDEAIRPAVREQVAAIAAAADAERRAVLVDSGYLMPHWPAPAGIGADAVSQIVIDQELARAGVERPDIVIAGWALPTIIEHGSAEQRERFVRDSLLGDLTWCQLFSEPGSGSDLASLRTKAVKVDGGWRLSGQKVWTSVAERADWGICLARTDQDAPPHKGISYFLVDMKGSEGLDIRPLREITGAALFNEVFLDDVFVPDECLVAQPGDGWRLARTTLANERIAMATSRLSTSTERAVSLAATSELTPSQRVRVGHSVALATVCSLLGVRTVLRSLAGQGPGAESSVAKLLGVRNRQDGAELVVELQGAAIVNPSAELGADVWEMLNTRCLSIAGGTTQILRNIAGERILGLPR
ncbi:MAG: acyl-CoA dehydrogenase [Nocardioides sp.]